MEGQISGRRVIVLVGISSFDSCTDERLGEQKRQADNDPSLPAGR